MEMKIDLNEKDLKKQAEAAISHAALLVVSKMVGQMFVPKPASAEHLYRQKFITDGQGLEFLEHIATHFLVSDRLGVEVEKVFDKLCAEATEEALRLFLRHKAKKHIFSTDSEELNARLREAVGKIVTQYVAEKTTS